MPCTSWDTDFNTYYPYRSSASTRFTLLITTNNSCFCNLKPSWTLNVYQKLTEGINTFRWLLITYYVQIQLRNTHTKKLRFLLSKLFWIMVSNFLWYPSYYPIYISLSRPQPYLWYALSSLTNILDPCRRFLVKYVYCITRWLIFVNYMTPIQHYLSLQTRSHTSST